MPKVALFTNRTKPCKHVHVSGRRCAQRVQNKRIVEVCGIHKEGCSECRSMMDAFQPPNGWPNQS